MIIPNMSLPEIRKSVSTDFEIELHRKLESLKVTSRGKWMRGGKQPFAETIFFVAKSKNSWRITITCASDGTINLIPYLITYDNIGITATHILLGFDNMPMMHFNTHFFKRYKERGKIALEKPEDIVKHFFRKNTILLPCYQPNEDGTQQLFTPLDGGIGLGIFYVDSEICEFKTFVDNSLLRQDQKDEIAEIWRSTINQLAEELGKRLGRK